MIDGWEDKTWWFMDDDSKIVFNVVIEYPKGKTPPAKLVELIELYSKGYRREKE